MSKKFFILSFVMFASVAQADIASTDYVSNKIEGLVDTSATANQTMAGSYKVTGALEVPTPPLPPAE